MKFRYFLMLIHFSLSIVALKAQTETYTGTIGGYKIIMELNTKDGQNYTGRYRYASKNQWIALKGKTEELTLKLKEFVNAKNTGIMDLVFEDMKVTGSWRKSINDLNPLQINLTFQEPSNTAMKPLPVAYYYAKTIKGFPDNELKIATINADEILASVFIANNENCEEFFLKGSLMKKDNKFEGVLTYDGPQDNLGNLDPQADVTITFNEHSASVEVSTHFGVGNGCFALSPHYSLQKKRKNGRLE